MQILHVLDVYLVVCMQKNTNWILPFNEIRINQITSLNMKCKKKNALRFTWTNSLI